MSYYNRNAHYWTGKEERAKKAARHAELIQKLYQHEIEWSVQNTRVYGPQAPDAPEKTGSPVFAYEDADTVSSAMAHADEEGLCVLNFASYKNPGGGFLAGSSAQEESLCHASDLYNVLKRFPEYYAWNNVHKNRALYTDRALFSPGIVFEKDGKKASASVITCAAPNFSAAERYGRASYAENLAVFKKRALFLRAVLESENIKTAILGAWGCGVFGQRPKDAAEILKEVFAESTAEKIIFAVPSCGHGKANADAFKAVCR